MVKRAKCYGPRIEDNSPSLGRIDVSKQRNSPGQINDLIIRETFAVDRHRAGALLGETAVWPSPWIIEDAKAESYGQPADNRGVGLTMIYEQPAYE